jgi:REP element-mobilizing transposase RayT
MARPLRLEYPSAVYHITSRGNGRNPIFDDDRDRKGFLFTLDDVVQRYRWICHAYCLMENHYHLLIETPEANLSRGMRQLNGVYTQRFNRRHKKTGHLFEGRFKAILVEKENYLLELCRYVVLNPVRAGMIERPESWKWSSYRPTAGFQRAPNYLKIDWILGLFDSRKSLAQKKYREFVREGIGQGAPRGKIRGQIFIGEEGFIKKFKDLLEDKKEVKEIPRLHRVAGRSSLQEIFTQRLGKGTRDAKIYLAHVDYGYTLKEIADYLGIHYTTVSKALNRQIAKK